MIVALHFSQSLHQAGIGSARQTAAIANDTLLNYCAMSHSI